MNMTLSIAEKNQQAKKKGRENNKEDKRVK